MARRATSKKRPAPSAEIRARAVVEALPTWSWTWSGGHEHGSIWTRSYVAATSRAMATTLAAACHANVQASELVLVDAERIEGSKNRRAGKLTLTGPVQPTKADPVG